MIITTMATFKIIRPATKVCYFPFRNITYRNSSMSSKQLVFSEYGDPLKVVKLEQNTLSEPKENEVLVRMLAATVNPADINTIQGSYAVKPQLPCIGGNEGVGEIEKVGAAVTDFKKGDRVLPKVNAWGTWRTHAVCDSKQLYKISGDLDVVEAATFSVNPGTAYRMLKDFVKLQSEDTVIQNGANSAVGQCVIQMCKAWGISSVNIVRKRDNIGELKDYLTGLGATHVLTEEELRTTDIFKKGVVKSPRLALNCVGGKNALEVMRHLAFRGEIVTYGGMSREPLTVSTAALIFKDLRVRGYWMTQWNKEHIGTQQWSEMINDITSMILAKQLKPPIHKVVSIDNFTEALGNTMNPKGFAGCKYILRM